MPLSLKISQDLGLFYWLNHSKWPYCIFVCFFDCYCLNHFQFFFVKSVNLFCLYYFVVYFRNKKKFPKNIELFLGISRIRDYVCHSYRCLQGRTGSISEQTWEWMSCLWRRIMHSSLPAAADTQYSWWVPCGKVDSVPPVSLSKSKLFIS